MCTKKYKVFLLYIHVPVFIIYLLCRSSLRCTVFPGFEIEGNVLPSSKQHATVPGYWVQISFQSFQTMESAKAELDNGRAFYLAC